MRILAWTYHKKIIAVNPPAEIPVFHFVHPERFFKTVSGFKALENEFRIACALSMTGDTTEDHFREGIEQSRIAEMLIIALKEFLAQKPTDSAVFDTFIHSCALAAQASQKMDAYCREGLEDGGRCWPQLLLRRHIKQMTRKIYNTLKTMHKGHRALSREASTYKFFGGWRGDQEAGHAMIYNFIVSDNAVYWIVINSTAFFNNECDQKGRLLPLIYRIPSETFFHKEDAFGRRLIQDLIELRCKPQGVEEAVARLTTKWPRQMARVANSEEAFGYKEGYQDQRAYGFCSTYSIVGDLKLFLESWARPELFTEFMAYWRDRQLNLITAAMAYFYQITTAWQKRALHRLSEAGMPAKEMLSDMREAQKALEVIRCHPEADKLEEKIICAIHGLVSYRSNRVPIQESDRYKPIQEEITRIINRIKKIKMMFVQQLSRPYLTRVSELPVARLTESKHMETDKPKVVTIEDGAQAKCDQVIPLSETEAPEILVKRLQRIYSHCHALTEARKDKETAWPELLDILKTIAQSDVAE